MPSTTHFDALQLSPVGLPYNIITSPLDDERVFVDGSNLLVTPGGVLRKRPGLTGITGTSIGLRCDRLWTYETMEPSPKVYILGSFYDPVSDRWKMYYWRSGTGSWTAMTGVRSVDDSTRPHEIGFSRGLAFIKSFPPSGSTDKLGTAVFDGTNASLRLWGLMGPNEPAEISGVMTQLTADVDGSTTSISVESSSGFPATPFVVLVDYELMNVTAVSGTTWTVSRGYLNTPINTHRNKAIVLYRDWNPSDHNVTVNSGWQYVYAYKTNVDGHVSNRSPLQDNPDKLPSNTRYFFDQIPKLRLQAHTDTTNVPEIVVYRTTDGGGTFYYLETVSNSGTSPQVYYDDSLESGSSGGTFNDPVPDKVLNTIRRAPSLTSNSPPPTVLLPKVLGVDTPEPSTKIVSYANRLWYAIGNVLFFSAQEELDEGVPEHAWPSGTFGNFFKLTEPITNLEPTIESLWVFTPTTVYRLTGTNLETFSLRPYFKNVGAIADNPNAVIAFKNRVAMITSDFRIMVFSEGSEPVSAFQGLGDTIRAHAEAGAKLELRYYASGLYEWLIFSANYLSTPSQTRHYVLDLTHQGGLLNVPWSISSTTSVVSRTLETPEAPKLVFALWDGTTTRLAYLDFTKAADINPTTGADQGFQFFFSTYMFQVPPGNHINTLRRPAMYPKVQKIEIENNGPVPVIEYFPDRLVSAGGGLTGTVETREYLASPGGFTAHVVPVDHVCYRLGLKVSSGAGQGTTYVEFYSLNVVWYPEAGI